MARLMISWALPVSESWDSVSFVRSRLAGHQDEREKKKKENCIFHAWYFLLKLRKIDHSLCPKEDRG